MHPLQAAAAARSGLVATTEQVEAIFANLNDILRLSEAVILRLKEGVAQDAVGKAFLNFVRLYSNPILMILLYDIIIGEIYIYIIILLNYNSHLDSELAYY
jgi:hypothetical protein